LNVAGNEREVVARWQEELRFAASGASGPPIVVDGMSAVALSPVELLLVAAATCTGSDIVVILKKQRVTLRSLEIAARGTRREAEPRRYTAIHFRVAVAGDGADEVKVRRAIDLSLEKYCSVVASLAPDMHITYDVALR
jgi:putative redox protein